MKIRLLNNGVQLVIIPLIGLRSVTIEVLLKIGAKYESRQEAGLSHFLEHMAFKGTLKRPLAKDIFNEMDSLGAGYDAGTGYENTSYSITTVAENLDWSMEMMSDILFNSQMPENEVAKERGVIAEEIKMYKDNPLMGMSSELMKFLYGGTKIGCWNISGEECDVVKVTRDDIVGYRNRYFNPKAAVVMLAGNVVESDMDRLVGYFENWDPKTSENLPELDLEFTKEKVKQDIKDVEQGHLAVAVPAFGSLDKRRYALRLMDIILSGNSSSRLFELLRSKKGWAYYVTPIGETIAEGGFWGVQAGVPLNKVSEAVEVVEEELLKFGDSVELAEVDRAKTYLKGKVELLLDRSDFWTGYVGDKVLLEGKLVSPEEELSEYGRVTVDEIRELAKTLFVKNSMRHYTISR